MEKNNYVCMYMYIHIRMYSTSKEGGANFCHNFFCGIIPYSQHVRSLFASCMQRSRVVYFFSITINSYSLVSFQLRYKSLLCYG